MSLAFLRYPALASVIVLLAGCGGSGSGRMTGGGGGGSPTVVTVTFKGGTPTAVAAKIGSGAFTAQTPGSSPLSLSIPSGTTNFAVAYLCPPEVIGTFVPFKELFQTVLELSTTDGTSFTATCPSFPDTPPGPTGILSGSVDTSAISGASAVVIEATNSSFLLAGAGNSISGAFSFDAPAGNDRVEVLAFNTGVLGAVEPPLLAARNFNAQPVPGALNGGNPVVLGAADATTTQSITYTGVPSGYSAPSTIALFEMSGAGSFGVSGLPNQYASLPAGAVQSGDLYTFLSRAYNATNPGEGVVASVTSTTGGPVAITFPPAWSYAGPAPARLPTFDFVYSGFSGKTGVVEAASIVWASDSLTENFFQVLASASYQNGSTRVVFPDLSGLTGFLPPPPSGNSLTWVGLIDQSSSGVLQPGTSNVTFSGVQNGGTYTVP